MKPYQRLFEETIDTKVISAFPGCGKSYLKQHNPDTLDSDSSLFSWAKPGERNPDFPANYIQHIKDNIGKARYILVSSHDEVRKALEDADISFYLVFPEKECKEEYIARYVQRGSPEKFIELLNKNWDAWIDSCENQANAKKVRLKCGQYLQDVINQL